MLVSDSTSVDVGCWIDLGERGNRAWKWRASKYNNFLFLEFFLTFYEFTDILC